MNKKLNPNFSLKKLLLSALVAGPLAILPAPLWALPSTAATNLTTSSTSITFSGVLDGVAPGALNITAPDKSILTWQNFGINAADTINYLLPSTTASVLNNVAGGAASTIAGAINSNGNVYVLNPAGIVISQTSAPVTRLPSPVAVSSSKVRTSSVMSRCSPLPPGRLIWLRPATRLAALKRVEQLISVRQPAPAAI
jgi:filamentous hemagglutinin family protein